MGHAIHIETPAGERLFLHDAQSKLKGRALAYFLIAASGPALSDQTHEIPGITPWFRQLDSFLDKPVRELLRPALITLYYHSDDTSGTDMAWVDAKQLQDIFARLLSALRLGVMQPTLWYFPPETEEDLELGIQLLDSLLQQNIRSVRTVVS